MNNKVSVALITPTYFHEESVLGGGERYVHSLAKELLNSPDVEVKVISFNKAPSEKLIDNVPYKIFRHHFLVGGSKINPFSFAIFKEVLKYDVIHIHQKHNFQTQLLVFWCYINSIPVVITDHGGGGIRLFRDRITNDLANYHLPVSNYSRKTQEISDNYCILYGGAEKGIFKKIKTDANKNQIISFGRFLEHKGFHHLISALPDNVSLLLAGRKSDETYFKSLSELASKKNVTISINPSDDELLRFISESSLAVFPSTQHGLNGNLIEGYPELLGLAPLEAFYCETPVLVSDVCAYPELMKSDRFTFKDGDTKALHQKIVDFLKVKKEDLYETQKEEIRVQKYSWEEVANKCIKVYMKFS